MRIYKLILKPKIALLWTTVLLSLALLLIFPTECRNGGTNGVFLCLQVLIPSLFPFMIISSFVAKSGLAYKTPKFIDKLINSVFKLPSCAFAPILLSIIGGYPVGAATIKELYCESRLTKSQSERMAMFCVSAGPGFLLTYIGTVMTRNLRLGYILLASQILSLIILGIIARFTINPLENETTHAKKNMTHYKAGEALVYSIETAIKTSVSMCALIVIFSSVSEIFITLCNKNTSLIWITSLIEITNGIKIISSGYPAIVLAFVCGFGGFCVHFQIFVQLKEIRINKCNFYIFRLFQGTLCALITSLFIKIFPITKTVFSTIEKAETKFYTTSVGCIFLILLCVAFIICSKQKRI